MTTIANENKIYHVKFKEVTKRKIENKVYDGKVTELSDTGMFILTDNELPEDSLLDIHLELDKDTVVKIEGVVLWKASSRIPEDDICGMAVEFYFKNWQDYKTIQSQIGHVYKTSFANTVKTWVKHNVRLDVALILLGIILLWVIFFR